MGPQFDLAQEREGGPSCCPSLRFGIKRTETVYMTARGIANGDYDLTRENVQLLANELETALPHLAEHGRRCLGERCCSPRCT